MGKESVNNKGEPLYRGSTLKKGSKAYELWFEAKKDSNYKKLDLHLKEVDQNEKQLLDRYK